MPHTITPTNAGNVTAIVVPSPGDKETAASVEIGFQGCANLAAYCRAFLLGTQPGASMDAPFMGNAILANPTINDPALFGTTTVHGPLVGDGALLGLSQLGEFVHCFGSSTFEGAMQLNGNTNFAAGKIHQFDGALVMAGGGSVSAPFNLALGAGVQLLNAGVIKNTGNGCISPRRVAMTVGADLTVDPRTCDVVTVPAGQTPGRTLTIGNGGGDLLRLKLSNRGANGVTLVGTGLGGTLGSSAVGTFSDMDLLWNGSSWEQIGGYLWR